MAEADIGLGGSGGLSLLFAALEFGLVKPRPQHPPGRGPVLVLRSLVLALHDDAGRKMGDAHRAVGGVDMLAARARGAIGVDANILLVDSDLDRVVDRRVDRHRGETRVSARIGVEG